MLHAPGLLVVYTLSLFLRKAAGDASCTDGACENSLRDEISFQQKTLWVRKDRQLAEESFLESVLARAKEQGGTEGKELSSLVTKLAAIPGGQSLLALTGPQEICDQNAKLAADLREQYTSLRKRQLENHQSMVDKQLKRLQALSSALTIKKKEVAEAALPSHKCLEYAAGGIPSPNICPSPSPNPSPNPSSTSPSPSPVTTVEPASTTATASATTTETTTTKTELHITICHHDSSDGSRSEISIPWSQWADHKANGDTLGLCDRDWDCIRIQICLLGTSEVIQLRSWATLEALGAELGFCKTTTTVTRTTISTTKARTTTTAGAISTTIASASSTSETTVSFTTSQATTTAAIAATTTKASGNDRPSLPGESRFGRAHDRIWLLTVAKNEFLKGSRRLATSSSGMALPLHQLRESAAIAAGVIKSPRLKLVEGDRNFPGEYIFLAGVSNTPVPLPPIIIDPGPGPGPPPSNDIAVTTTDRGDDGDPDLEIGIGVGIGVGVPLALGLGLGFGLGLNASNTTSTTTVMTGWQAAWAVPQQKYLTAPMLAGFEPLPSLLLVGACVLAFYVLAVIFTRLQRNGQLRYVRYERMQRDAPDEPFLRT
eukprot:TRINITY_DN2029_c0_g1_i1.p1 TRINITY_DN2029_c0_g1~~TRINITY_DN2029_c0_g1_i1.p1  ORF type:complete len:602 (+),score=86.20 TRINITY_DN2029_c0_g1_i1:117-1922(+)